IVLLGISSDMESGKLQTFIEDEIVSRFERIDGVASVNLYGGDEKEVKVQIDQEKLAGYGLSLEGIKNILKAENLNLPGGTVKKGDKELLTRSMGEFQSIEDIKDIPITLKSGEIIKLSDIAEVTYGYKDRESLFRVDGENALGLGIQKQSVANTVKVSKEVMKEVAAIEKEYPELKVIVGMDQAEYINKSIQNVAQNAIVGGILAVIILYLFLRNIRSTFIIGIAIPVSIVTTFALMYFGGLTLNLLSLGGLALGVGMLVDNSIVVLENIYRLREEGYSRKEAAVEGAKGVGMAVFASTMTTIAVFLPIVFVGGLISILFKELSFTVTFSLLASLVVSLTVVPMLASKLLEAGEVKQRKRIGFSLGKVLDLFSVAITGVSKLYERIVRYTIHHRKITVLGAIVLLIVSFGLMGIVGAEFFPKEDEGSFTVSIELPYGTSLEESDKIVSEVENIIENIPETETIITTIGAQYSMMGGSSNSSSLMVKLVDAETRSRTTEEVVSEVRKEIENIAGAQITVTESSSMMGGGGTGSSAAIQLEIKGDDIEMLKTIGEDVQEIFKSIPGTAEVELNMEEGDPEARVKIDRKKASFYGITAYQLANVLNASIDGLKATTYKVDGDEIDVNLMLSDHVKESVENMKQILIPSPTGQMVPIGQIAEIEYGNSPSQIFRNNQVRTVQVSSQLVGRDLRSVTEDIQNRLETYSMPSGYTYNFTGQQQDMEEAFKSLGLALILSIALIYMILASQFESLVHPLTVMFSVPFALSGGLLGLFLTGRALS
ncbi:MAG TPA: efflux RND transporter permease subunit, partial [Clostridiales bacterium]|nr:efflux RND transporter permease subunit [Clostridiales bacterium]